VLLQHISGFQQLFKSLLVENWFFLLIGHDVFGVPLVASPQRRSLADAQTSSILVQFRHQRTYVMRSTPGRSDEKEVEDPVVPGQR
jgi:hypothetical protein